MFRNTYFSLIVLGLFCVNSANANMSGSASNASSQAALGGALNAAQAGYFWSMCGPHNGWACALGAMASANAAMSFATSKKQAKTAADLSCNAIQACNSVNDLIGGNLDLPGENGSFGSGSSGFNNNNYKEFINQVNELDLAARNLQNQLAQKGYQYDPATGSVSSPDGTSYSSSDFSSPESMSSLGMDQNSINEVLKGTHAYGEVKKKGLIDKLKLKGFDSFGGSGNSSYANTNTDNGINPALRDLMKQMNGTNGKARDISSAGLSKRLANGDKIGVSGDDIFKILSRKYSDKRKEKAFLP